MIIVCNKYYLNSANVKYIKKEFNFVQIIYTYNNMGLEKTSRKKKTKKKIQKKTYWFSLIGRPKKLMK